MTDPTIADPAIAMIASSPTRSLPTPTRSLPTSPTLIPGSLPLPRVRQSSSPVPGMPDSSVRSTVTDFLDIPSEQQLSSTDGDSNETDDDTSPSSATPAGDERSQEENPATIGLFNLNTNKRVGTIIDVSEDTQVYNIVGNMPEADGDIYEGEVRPLIFGFLRKLGRNGKWQRRFFETDGECLTYFKSDKRVKVLASLDLSKVGAIAMSPDDPVGCTFVIQVVDRPYSLRAESKATCKDWVITLNRIKEARLQMGGVKLVPPEFHQTANSLEKGEFREITPRVVLSANRQRTRAVDGENVNSWESLMQQENNQNAIRESETKVHHKLQSEILARWQKRRSMLYSLSRAAVRWARSVREKSCASSAHEQVRLDAHLHPPGHDDARSSASTNSDLNDHHDSKLNLEPSWPSPPPPVTKTRDLNVAARAHEIT